jgi:hypothetical protein
MGHASRNPAKVEVSCEVAVRVSFSFRSRRSKVRQ